MVAKQCSKDRGSRIVAQREYGAMGWSRNLTIHTGDLCRLCGYSLVYSSAGCLKAEMKFIYDPDFEQKF